MTLKSNGILRTFCFAATLLMTASAGAHTDTANTQLTVVSGKTLEDGSAFANAEVERGTEDGVAYAQRLFNSTNDSKLMTGIYEAAPTSMMIESYPGDEFMYFITGSGTLTDKSGKVTKFGPGEGVFMPKGWSGKWESTAYRKYFVYYRPDAD